MTIFQKLIAVLTVTLLANTAIADHRAPDFVLKSNQGHNVRLSELKGEVVLINFWATWCGPCRQEMPILNEIHQRYKDMGFTVLGVNVEKSEDKANNMLAKNPVSFPILYDTNSEVSKLYKVDAMPTTVVVDRDGMMRHLHRGYKPGYEDAYSAQIKQLFREQYAATDE